MTTIYRVIKIECWPAKWYGGPVFGDDKASNCTAYYWRTREEAQKFCDEMNEHLGLKEK